VTISGLTLTGGRATDGAAILNAGDLTLSKDVIFGNVAQGIAGGGLFGDGGGRGGGIENQAGAILDVLQSLLKDNQALGGPQGSNAFGGGIDNEAGTITLDHSVLTGNQATAGNGGSAGAAATLPGGISATLLGVSGGGGIWNDGGSVNCTSSTLTNNRDQGGSNNDASGSTATFTLVGTALGGAVGSAAFFTTATPTVTIADSTLSGNESLGGTNVTVANVFVSPSDAGSGRGGAVGVVAGNLTVTNSALSANLAEGGALATSTQSGPGHFIQVSGSPAFGGGIDDEFNLGFFPSAAAPTLRIADSTISGNVARGSARSASATGGGLDAGQVDAQLTDSTVSGDQALGGPAGGFNTYYGYSFNLGGGGGNGGGIASGEGSLTISGSSVQDNRALGSPGGATFANGRGGSALAGGILSTGQSFGLTNSILSGNEAIGGDATSGYLFGGGGTAGGLYLNIDIATIRGTTIATNLAQGGAGRGTFSDGSAGAGAADAGGATALFTSLQLSGCTFAGNEALGGAGETGSSAIGPNGGGEAFAGGLHIDTGTTASISNTAFIGNLARGGAGGAGDAGGAGGFAFGGGLANVLATTTVSNCTFALNGAQGGTGGSGGAGAKGGAGGDGQGGAVWNVLAFAFVGQPELTSLNLTNCTLAGNLAGGGAGGAAGAGATGGSGGNGEGGGFYNSTLGITGQVLLTISACLVTGNEADGGAGTGGGNGGNGEGGGLFNDAGAMATVLSSVISGNQADGGAAAGGSEGRGVGGGVYNLGTFDLDSASCIDGNHASTSNDNVFGPVTPV
jgi:hypothetical protein